MTKFTKFALGALMMAGAATAVSATPAAAQVSFGIGIGLYLSIQQDEFPEELRDTAMSIFDTGHGTRGRGSTGPSPLLSGGPPPSGPPLAAEVLSRHLDRWVNAEPDAVLAAWRTRDALRGREVAWEGGSGVADGIDDRGYLVVVTPGGDRIAVGAGEVHLTRF